MQQDVAGGDALNATGTTIFDGRHTVVEVLSQLRTRLLDLTARNRLLNFRHSPTKTVGLVDVVPNSVYERLLEGKSLTIVPVPDPKPTEYEGEDRKQKPDVRAYAMRLGIATDYELPRVNTSVPARGTEGQKLRTLSYPSETERLCRRVSNDARSAIEETGANMLYVVFGFLEFFEAEHSERPLLAPLISVPVAIKRGHIDRDSRLHLYDIAYTGEEVVENLSLREKLRTEFAMELPTFGEERSPEDYFAEVEDAIALRPRWKVRRRMSLALLSFAKMLLVNDLDPRNWPQGFNRTTLEEHNLVRTVFGDLTPEEGSGAEVGDYDIDNHDERNLSLIYDADTSQHSALIDALGGRNLVVKGPPGTGKSQSITNLIAEALVRGQSILFMSEKLAALQVVKHRLDMVGLGDFCLELHSHKTQKKRVLEDLERRFTSRYQTPRGFESDLKLLEQERRQLQAYADLMNTRLGNELELTVFEVLWRAEKYRQQTGEAAPELETLVVPDAPSMDHVDLEQRRSAVESLARHFAEIGAYGRDHPWYGFFPKQLSPGDDLEVQAALSELVSSIETVRQCATAFNEVVRHGTLPTGRAEQLSLLAHLASVQQPPENACLELLPVFFPRDDRRGVEAASTLASLRRRVDQAKGHIEAIRGTLHEHLVPARERVNEAKARLERLASHRCTDVQISELESRRERIGRLIHGSEQTLAFFSELHTLVGCTRSNTDSDISRAIAICQVCSNAPRDLLEFRHASLARSSSREVLESARAEANRLAEERTALGELFYMDERPSETELSHALQTLREGEAWYRFLQSRWRRALRFYRTIAKDKTNRPASACLSHLTRLARFLRDEDVFTAHAEYKGTFGQLFRGNNTDFERLGRLVTWFERAKELLATSGLELTDFDLVTVEEHRVAQLSARWSRAEAHGRALREAQESLAELTAGSPLAVTIEAVSTSWEARIECARTLSAEFGEASTFFLTVGPADLTASGLTEAMERQIALYDIRAGLDADTSVRSLLGEQYAGLETDFEALEQTLAWGRSVTEAGVNFQIRELLLSPNARENLTALQIAGARLASAWKCVEEFSMRMASIAEFDWEAWMSVAGDKAGAEDETAIVVRATHALGAMSGLLPWCQYLHAREQVDGYGLTPFVEKLESRRVPNHLLGTGLLYRLHASIAKSIFRQQPILAHFSGMSYAHARESFAKLDRQIIKRRGAECAARIAANTELPSGTASPRVDERTEMELLRHLMTLQRPRTPIRQMLKRAGRAIQALKPCFMMGPLAVAQYLEPGSVEFDIVVMDEASQLKPEEAIGAVARGKQLIVVGDQKQLPPTSFFDRMMTVEEEDDSQASIATSSESILDICISVFPSRTLRWHYRSKHESLIAFSNHRFYEGRLIVFPSPYPQTKRLGVRYHHVTEGAYQNRQNVPEARRVVDAIVEHMQTRPDESLGVVTLNITQRDLIEELIEQRLRSFEAGEKYKARWEAEGWPFFIKNLENVQGDERHVILISTTFGKALGTTAVRQNFGPISREHGGRRLNVLFTRAQHSVHVYSSMLPEDIVIDGRTPQGTADLRGYLEYALRGTLEGARVGPRPPDSDFEVSVASVLEARGFEVVPQLGLAGYFIDLAVRNPDRRGEFLAAIECDGASYHSGVSVRDRDRIRQEILESLGWKDRIWRIWSADWFRNPKHETERLLSFLDTRRAASLREPVVYHEEAQVERPTADRRERSAPRSRGQVQPQLALEAIAQVNEDEELFVEVGDRVTYVDLDEAPNEKRSICIVSTGHDPSSGIINEAKPLAQALIGAAEGDVKELSLDGRPTKHLKVARIERKV
jgi:transcription elongation GreA/GreB family factor/very-short-patch-repair endonuclease